MNRKPLMMTAEMLLEAALLRAERTEWERTHGNTPKTRYTAFAVVVLILATIPCAVGLEAVLHALFFAFVD